MPKQEKEEAPPSHILEEILAKFIYSAPVENLENWEQLMFLVEHAWWYYEDCVREKYTHLQHFSHYNTFARMLFDRCNALKEHAADLPNILDRYREYKANIPVYGAVLMDSELERVLLVRGYKSASSWGFPRGKVNHKESDIACACREVLEETGLVIDSMVRPDDMIEATLDNKHCQLFIVSGLDPEEAKFAPQVQKEIGAFAWHYLHELPATVEEANRAYVASGGSRHRFFMVQPFVSKLRAWVTHRRRELGWAPAPWDSSNKKGNQQQQLKQQQPQLQRSQAGPSRGSVKDQQLGGSTTPSASPAVAAAAVGVGMKKAKAPYPLHASDLPCEEAASVASSIAAGGARAQSTPTQPSAAAAGKGGPCRPERCELPNLVMSSAFRFDKQAIMECLAGPS